MDSIIYSRRGQTLVEALIALSILTMGFVGIVALLTKSFQLNRITTDDTQATYLAEEGIEIAKNLIDYDVYAGIAVGVNDFGTCFPNSGYYYPIDYTTVDKTPGGPPDCSNLSFSLPDDRKGTPLYFNPTTHTFTANAFGAEPTDFTRYIMVTDINNAAHQLVELDVQSTVVWVNGTLSDTITLEDHFYDWHP